MNAAAFDGPQPGSRLGPYEVTGTIGAGGMGVVYRARDTRLARDVALKFLPSHLSRSEDARERLRREARAIAALQHPNICAIYDVGEEQDQLFLVVELLSGETLQQRIGRGVMPLDDALDIGAQLASALATAHGAGIIHRDIKPANIFLTDHGPKVLDFGLAKVVGPAAASDSTALLTEPGGVVGTAAYMSPEQLRGEELDGRSDVFSLGLVLYEMVTGKRAFGRSTAAATAGAILHERPEPVRTLNAAVPPHVDASLMRALEKSRDLRYQSAADFRSALLDARTPGTPRRVTRTVGITAAAAIGVVVLILAVVNGSFTRSTPPRLTERDTIVIADFRNTTGDALFDDTLRQGLTVQLQQSPFLAILPDTRMRRTLALMGRSADEPLTGVVTAEVCVRTGSAAFLEGSIAPLGSRYVVGLKATSCQDEAVIDEGQVEADRKEDVLRALGELATGFRQRSGESLASQQRFAAAIEDATTPSLDAWKAHSAGSRLNALSGPAAAIPLWKRAVEIDPLFASAWAMLGLAYNRIGEEQLALEAATTAHTLRERTTDRERFMIEGLYQRQIGNLDQARQVFESWVATYPRDADGHSLLAGFSTHGTGRYEQAINESETALTIDPDRPFGYLNLITANIYLDRFDEAERAIQRAVDRKMDIAELLLFRYQLSFLRGNRDAMARDRAAARNLPAIADRAAYFESLIAARDGRFDAARDASRRAIALAEQSGRRGTAAIYHGAMAVWEALSGHTDPARKAALAALALSDSRDVSYAAAFAFARIGERARASVLAASLERRFPQDTSVRYNYLPSLRALDALQARDPERALTVLEGARTYELAVPSLAFEHIIGTFYPPFVRGEAYLALGRRAEAIGEFGKILEHRGLLLADPVGAVIERELAALRAQGSRR